MHTNERAMGLGFGTTAVLFALGAVAVELTDVTATFVGGFAGLLGGLVAGYASKARPTTGAEDGGVASAFGAIFALPVLAFFGVLAGELFGPADRFLFVSLAGVETTLALLTVVLALIATAAVLGAVGGAVGAAIGGRGVPGGPESAA